MNPTFRLGPWALALALACAACGTGTNDSPALAGPPAHAATHVEPTAEPTAPPTSGTDEERTQIRGEVSATVEQLLTYSPQSADAHAASVEPLLTEGYYGTWSDLWEEILPEVKSQELTATVDVVEASIISMTSVDAELLLFFNQTIQQTDGEPASVQHAAVAFADLVGDTWRIDDLNTELPVTTSIESDPERSAAIEAAWNVAHAFLAIDASTVDVDTARVLELTTGDFRAEYESSLEDLKSSVIANETSQKTDVIATGLSSFSDTEAVALVAASGYVSNLETPEPAQRNYRLKVTLTLVDGEWLAKGMDFVS